MCIYTRISGGSAAKDPKEDIKSKTTGGPIGRKRVMGR